MRSVLLACVLAAVAPTALCQDREFTIDFGHTSSPSTSRGLVWNNVDVTSQGVPLSLVQTNGTPSSVQLSFPPQAGFGRAETGGVQTPAPGSALAQLGWPASATSDALYSGATPVTSAVTFTLSGLDPTATFDLAILASVLGATDDLATSFTVVGADTAQTSLEPRDNTSSIAHLVGLRPDANSELTFETRAATTNTRPTRDYYLSALRLTEHKAGTQPPLLAFTSSSLCASRIAGSGPVSSTLATYTSGRGDPAVTLAAIDSATQLAPTWLNLPAGGLARTPFSVDLDPGTLGLGVHVALVTASAPGYTDATARVQLVVRPPGGPLNLLYYGNSYLKPPAGSLPDLVELAAQEAGFPVPLSVHRVALAKDLEYHATDPEQVEALSRSLPLGEQWDFVVIQGASLEPTVNAGDPAQFLAAAQQIVANVKAHSPGARACFLQTWARAAGHATYQGATPTFASPLEMHTQLEAGYVQATLAANTTWGTGAGLRAATGETAALLAFAPWIYGPDSKHPGPALATMGALNLLSAFTGERACDLPIYFEPPGPLGPLAAQLVALGIDSVTWRELAGLADRAGPPALRRHPGSSEDLLLTTGAGQALNACSLERLRPGARLSILLSSPNATYAGAAATLHADLFPNGQAPGPYPPSPELHFDPATAWVLATTPSLGPSGLSATLVVQPWMVGRTLLIQGLVQAPSPKTGQPITASDAHEVRTGSTPSFTEQL